MILSLVSRKGGVGKSTSAVNLSAALVGQGFSTLLVDLDAQAAASVSLGVSRSDLAPSSGDILLRRRPAREVIRSTAVPGLDLITASVDLQSAEGDLKDLRQSELVLAKALAPIRDRYHFVVIDCPPSLGYLTRNALAASDRYLVLVVPHFLAMEGIEPVISGADRLKFRIASSQELLGVLITMTDRRARFAKDNVRALRRTYGDLVLSSEIRSNVRLAEAPAHGQTIFQYDDESHGATDYRRLAREVLERCGRQGGYTEHPPDRQGPSG